MNGRGRGEVVDVDDLMGVQARVYLNFACKIVKHTSLMAVDSRHSWWISTAFFGAGGK